MGRGGRDNRGRKKGEGEGEKGREGDEQNEDINRK